MTTTEPITALDAARMLAALADCDLLTPSARAEAAALLPAFDRRLTLTEAYDLFYDEPVARREHEVREAARVRALRTEKQR